MATYTGIVVVIVYLFPPNPPQQPHRHQNNNIAALSIVLMAGAVVNFLKLLMLMVGIGGSVRPKRKRIGAPSAAPRLIVQAGAQPAPRLIVQAGGEHPFVTLRQS